MPHWYSTEITKEDIVENIDWVNSEYLDVKVSFKNLNFEGSCVFTISIDPNEKGRNQGLYGQMRFNLGEQFGCCGYGNLFYPRVPYEKQQWLNVLKVENLNKKIVELAEYCSVKLCLSGIKYIGIKTNLIIDELKKNKWKVVHNIVNPRYGDNGSKLVLLCKNLNPYKKINLCVNVSRVNGEYINDNLYT